MYIATLSSAPEVPSVGLGFMDPNTCLDGPAYFAATDFSERVRVLTLKDYPRGVEPLVGLIARFLAQWPVEDRPPAKSWPTYASLSIYTGPTPKGARLVEYLLAKSNGAIVTVGHCDDLEERRAVNVARPYPSHLDFVRHAISVLLWRGAEPPVLTSLSSVPIKGEGPDARVLESDIPPYAHSQLLHWLGGFRGPTSDAFFLADWQAYLATISGTHQSAPGSDRFGSS